MPSEVRRYRGHVKPSAGASTQHPHGRELDELTAAIDRNAEVPVGLQLSWVLGARIRSGELEPGARLPGLRELARASGLNVNTVRAVYQRLEQQGLLESHQGRGTFVASTPRAPSAVGTIAADAALQAQATGVSPREVAAALYMAPPQDGPQRARGIATGAIGATSATGATEAVGATGATGAPGASHGDGAAHRRALRTQIAALERAIGVIEAEHPGVAPPPSDARPGGPRLLNAEELEQVRSTLVQRLASVQAAIDKRAASERAASERAASETEQSRAKQKTSATSPAPRPAQLGRRTRALPT
jgi:DNA-binding transcriptional regulator YhcF (GntR family)